MTEKKNEEKKGGLILLNQGSAKYQLKPLMIEDGVDAEGKKKYKTGPARILLPGGTIEALDQEEFDHFVKAYGRNGVKDASKVVPQQGQRVEELQTKVQELEETIAQLRAAAGDDKVSKKGK